MEIFDLGVQSQNVARDRLKEQGLDIENLEDLGNGWSIRWSAKVENKKKESRRRLLLQWYVVNQCICS